MPKKIVLLSDGTGNSAGRLFKTNVWRLYDALDLSGGGQVASYNDGVGTSSFKPLAILGGAVGWGLKRNVLDLYSFLCRNYEPGDDIYAFGFSRGAFTIRVLVGLIVRQGLVPFTTEPQLGRDAREAYRSYRRQRYRSRLRVEAPFRFARDTAIRAGSALRGRGSARAPEPRRVKIRFLGLWDTVDAYGLPVDELQRAWDNYFWPLSIPDRELSPIVTRACHAVSLDDERNTFHPVLWDERDEPLVAHLDQERISQVWFAGVHSNIGGGYPDDALSNVTLDWMMGEADRNGLRFKTGARRAVRAAIDGRGRIYDSRHGLSGYYRYNPRKIEKLANDRFDGVSIPRPKIHESALERIRSGTDGYAPIVLPGRYAVVTAAGRILEGTGNPFEHPSQSVSRANEQERAWNWVWGRRVVYFATVLASLYLAILPLDHPARLGGCATALCFLSSVIGAAGAVLPGFASPWIEAFKSNPGVFALRAGLVACLLVLGGWLQRKTAARMRLVWGPIIAAGPRPVLRPHPVPRDLLYRLRSHPSYQAFFRALTEHVIPFFFVLCILIAAPTALSRILFGVGSSMGWVCAPHEKLETVITVAPAQVHFDPRRPCWASGLSLDRGVRYRIWIRLEGAPSWRDGAITTDLGGFASRWTRVSTIARLPLRRHLTEAWFKPIARIGAQGSDEYPLGPAVPSARHDDGTTMMAEITARTTGEFFLYVNDAVIGFPVIFDAFYRNNHGRAHVTVERVRPPNAPAATQ